MIGNLKTNLAGSGIHQSVNLIVTMLIRHRVIPGNTAGVWVPGCLNLGQAMGPPTWMKWQIYAMLHTTSATEDEGKK